MGRNLEELREYRREKSRQWRAKNSERNKELSRQRYAKDPKRHRESTYRWRAANPERSRRSRLKKKYNISELDYQKLLQLQNGVCAICKKPPGKIWLSVDHDHVTGKVRGLLHNSCNAAIGLLDDDPYTIEQALSYILKHRNLEK